MSKQVPLRRSRAARPAAVVALAAAALLLAACGSRVDPATVGAVAAGTGQVTGEGAVGVDPATGAVPGSGDVGGTTGGTAGTEGTSGTSGTSGSTGSGTTGGSSAGAPTGDGEQGDGENAADGGVKAASCKGFKNSTGMTDDSITIANVADISGPVPGIFESAQQATKAYVAYFNSSGDICGRSLKVLALDSRADAGADQQAYTRACDDAFAAVGSMSAFDAGGAKTAEDCGLPDVRSYSVSGDRTACTTCFAAYAVKPFLVPNAMPQWWAKKEPEAVKSVGMFYVNSGAAIENAKNFRAGWEANGWDVKVFEPIDTGEFNYAPYVQQMKEAGVKLVNYTGPYQFTIRLQQAMKQQGYEAEVFLQDATIYDQRYVEEAGEAAEGVFVYSQTALFDDFSIPEMKLYRSWLQQVDPGATPNAYGLYAWSATRLFVERATALGGGLDRASLVADLGKVRDWTGNGVHVPQQVGAETTANCASIIQYTGGQWKQVSPGKYLCGQMTNTGLGG